MTESLKEWILSFSSGQTWLNKLSAPITKRQFTSYLKQYCEAVKKTPDELITLKMEGLKNVGTEKEFQAENLLEGFFSESKMSQSAKLNLRNAVFSFFKHNRRALEAQTASNIKAESPESKKRRPDLEDLTALEAKAHLAKDKAFIWFIASTSCREGTISLLKWEDLKPTENKNVPYSLEIDSTKLKGKGIGKYRGLKQITFVHRYAYEKLLDYKEEAKLLGYELKPESPLFIAYRQKGKIQALSDKSMNALFSNLSLMAFGDLEVKRFSPQDLREFFQSACESASIQSNMISPLMAHKIKGVDAHYSSHDKEELLVKYETALPWLIPETLEQVKAKSLEIKTQQQQQIEGLKAEHKKESEEQNKKIEELEDHFEAKLAETMKKAIDAINEFSKEAQKPK